MLSEPTVEATSLTGTFNVSATWATLCGESARMMSRTTERSSSERLSSAAIEKCASGSAAASRCAATLSKIPPPLMSTPASLSDLAEVYRLHTKGFLRRLLPLEDRPQTRSQQMEDWSGALRILRARRICRLPVPNHHTVRRALVSPSI